MQHVSSNLSKIPYGGFSPVRLQTGLLSRSLHRLRRLISGQLHGSCLPRRPRAVSGQGAGSPSHSGPEALGSASGCSVPSHRCLLWPHPSFWPAPAALWFSAAWSLPCGCWPEGPCFYLRILLIVPSPVPRQTGRPRTIVRPPVIAFARMRGARHLQSSHFNRNTWVPLRGAEFT
jgi:hypothetical protein